MGMCEYAHLQVRLLVLEGGANTCVRDRWGYTPLDEARRVGAAPVVKVGGAMHPTATDMNMASPNGEGWRGGEVRSTVANVATRRQTSQAVHVKYTAKGERGGRP